MNKTVKKVLVSEKSYGNATHGKFSFVVDKKASKKEIATVIANLFKVEVLKVNSMNYDGKIKQTRKNMGKRADFKKVVVTLKQGQKIDLFEIEDSKKEKPETKKSLNDVKTEVKTREKPLVRKAVKRVSSVNKTMEG